MDTTIHGTKSTYHIIKPLKSGGMGEVLLARDDMDRRVAIKRPFASAAEDGLARFNLEAQAATLDHPNIAKIYEAGVQADGRPYLAMEYVDGKELKDVIDSGEPLDLIVKLSIIEQVCAGLGYAHQKGFIHRDIKPGNIMVQANGVAKIIDFGIAKMIDVDQGSELTQASQVIGSLHYIAPERFKNEGSDGRVDVFSAGVMLYLLLTGKLPFTGGEATAAYQIVNEAPSALGLHLRDYPQALDGIVDQALAKNPEQRFATAEDFGDALHDVIESLKRSRVFRLFDDAERLTMENRYDPALEMLDEAMKLDPANTQVRKLRKLVRENQDRQKKALRLRDYVARAEEYLAVENYADALAQLKEGFRAVPTSQELKDQIAVVEAKKERHDASVAALAEAESAQNRGDITAALRISEAAVKKDPDNTRLLALRAAIANQLEREAKQTQVNAILDRARGELTARNFAQVEQLLVDAEAVDRTHPRIEELRREMARIREQEEHLRLLEEVRRHVNDFLRADNYEQATDLLNRAIERLPGETMLHRLKMEVDTAARKFDSIRFVDRALASAQEAFATDPQRSLEILREALQQLPGDERLIDRERSLRQEAETLRTRQLLNDSLRRAREFLAAEQFDQATDVLEAYQLEHGNQADVDDLLTFSRQEQASKQRKGLLERTVSEARSLMAVERLDDAVRLLESALQSSAIRESGDRTLSVLLEDVRAQQGSVARKRDAILKRATTHRDRGELDQATRILSEYLATGAQNAEAEDLLAALQTDRTRKQASDQAIASAEQATQQNNFAAALESLQAVVLAYGESEELAHATQKVQRARSTYAQQVVGQSIETSRAALLASDVPGALAALRGANEMVEYADAARQADWRRIGQAAKTAQSAPTGTVIADPLADLPELGTRKPASRLVPVLGALVAAGVIAGVTVSLLHKSPPPAALPTDAHLSVAKAPPGAQVSIDGGTRGATDSTGSLKITVSPGSHLLEVTKAGFDPYSEKFQVAAGDTFRDNIALAPLPPANNSGTLLMQGNLPGFKVMVDDHSRGEILKKEGSLTLEAGSHTIQYSNEDGSNSTPKHTVLIAAGKSLSDTFSLKPPKLQPPPIQTASLPAGSGNKPGVAPPAANTSAQPAPVTQPPVATPPPAPVVTTGSLSVQTTPGAQISLSGPGGKVNQTVDASGSLNLPNLPAGKYTLGISKDGFKSDEKPISISPGSQPQIIAELTPLAVAAAPPPPPVDHSAEDDKGIQAAVDGFEAAYPKAYKTKNLSQIPPAWLDSGKLKNLFEIADMARIQENCPAPPAISGNSATRQCTETAQFFKDTRANHPSTAKVTLLFTKSGSQWHLTGKNSK